MRWQHVSGVSLTAAGGLGLTHGFASPDVRALLSVSWTLGGPAPLASASPIRPWPSDNPRPETRRDGPEHDPTKPTAERNLAAPPTLPMPSAEPLSADVFDKVAKADPDPDSDGLFGAADKCPNKAEDTDGFEDLDGCPDPDNDRDGVLDGDDKCPLVKEVINGIDDEDGCPDEGKSSVAVSRSAITFDGKIYFAPGKDVIDGRSDRLLAEMAAALKAAWWVRRVRIEGHTDNKGDKEMNVDLSERRARRVMHRLTTSGVAAARLEAKGFGPTKPTETNDNPAGRAKNRRVVFQIVDVLPEEAP
ncbi:MAG: outer membrane protein OmpA-like peptidoglycan-associated protein [Myxococcota bacterium]